MRRLRWQRWNRDWLLGLLVEKKLQRFVDAGAVLTPGDIAARASDCCFYFGDCIGGASRHPRHVTIQHRDVVVMIARGENVFAGNIDQTRELGQDRALVIVGMTKSEINHVALI